MNRAPILMVGDLNIGQSKAIERYVAKRCSMMGSGDEEYAVIDCISEHTRDIREKWGKIRSTGGMAPSTLKDEATKKWFDVELKDWLVKLEKSLPEQVMYIYTYKYIYTYTCMNISPYTCIYVSAYMSDNNQVIFAFKIRLKLKDIVWVVQPVMRI
jgi:hypothetical protein